MRAREIMNELFQAGKQNWNWEFTGYDEATANFTVGDLPYKFYAFTTPEADGEWEVEFSIDTKKIPRDSRNKIKSTYGITGTGNAAIVMSTVTDILRDFLTQYKRAVQKISFTAAEPSRQALYKRMLQRLLPNWQVSEYDAGNGEVRIVASAPALNLTEGLNYPVIVVDVQPAYASYAPAVCQKVVEFVTRQTGPVLMFVNAERDGLTEDTVSDVVNWWEETAGYMYDEETEEYTSSIDWDRFEVVDKGYGWFRSYMDQGVSPATMIKMIRYLYQNKLNDARDVDYDTYVEIMGDDSLIDENFSVNWTSVAQLRRFNGAYIMGGGRDECLREVELLMNAFNIRYKRVDSLVY